MAMAYKTTNIIKGAAMDRASGPYIFLLLIRAKGAHMQQVKDRVNNTPKDRVKSARTTKDRVNIAQRVKDRVNKTEFTLNRMIFIICLIWYLI